MINASPYKFIKNPCSEIIIDTTPVDHEITKDIRAYFKNVLINIKSNISDIPTGAGLGRAILKINPVRMTCDPIYQLVLEFYSNTPSDITQGKSAWLFLKNIELTGYRYIPRSTKISGKTVSLGFYLLPEDIKYLESCIADSIIHGTKIDKNHYFDFNY